MSPFRDVPVLLFDLDGTLVDSAELILESWRHTMRVHFGEVPPDEVWMSTVGQPLRTQLVRFADTPEGVEALVATYAEHNRRMHRRLIRPFTGVRETLLALHARGTRLGIVTSKASRGATRALASCGLDRGLFQVIVTPDDPVPHKPDPAPVLLALDRMGATPEDAAFIGDSIWDLRAGRAAGARTGAALWGPFSRELLAEEDPDEMLETIHQLVP